MLLVPLAVMLPLSYCLKFSSLPDLSIFPTLEMVRILHSVPATSQARDRSMSSMLAVLLLAGDFRLSLILMELFGRLTSAVSSAPVSGWKDVQATNRGIMPMFRVRCSRLT